MKRRINSDVLTAAFGLVILAAITVLRLSGTRAEPSLPSTYDTGRNGFAALYELMERERIRVRRFESPIGQVPPRDVALVVAGDGALGSVAQSRGALEELDTWVRSGNRLYVFGAMKDDERKILGVPDTANETKRASAARTACGFASSIRGTIVAGDFSDGFAPGCAPGRAALLRTDGYAPAIAFRRGRGTIVVMTTTTALDNWDLARHGNARFAYGLFTGSPEVAFDERPYGYAAGRTFWQVLTWPVRAAILLTGLALFIALVGANIPFAPPYSPALRGERDSSAYIASLAQLLQRAAANSEIVTRLAAASEALLKLRTRNDDRSRALLQQARDLRAIPQPSSKDVLAAGTLFAAVRKDYE